MRHSPSREGWFRGAAGRCRVARCRMGGPLAILHSAVRRARRLSGSRDRPVRGPEGAGRCVPPSAPRCVDASQSAVRTCRSAGPPLPQGCFRPSEARKVLCHKTSSRSSSTMPIDWSRPSACCPCVRCHQVVSHPSGYSQLARKFAECTLQQARASGFVLAGRVGDCRPHHRGWRWDRP